MAELEPLALLAEGLAAEIARRYRISEAAALERIQADWAGDAELQNQAEKSNEKQLRRTRAYKDAAARVKKAIYYDLRRYRQTTGAISSLADLLKEMPRDISREEFLAVAAPALSAHVSTAERKDYGAELIDILTPVIDGPVIDIGCGIFPLLLYGVINCQYTAIDRDREAVNLLTAYRQWRGDESVTAVCDDFSSGLPPQADGCFSIALLLKTVPVLERQSPELLPIIAQIPAGRMILTGSRTSMTKRQSIARRERGILLRFAEEYRLTIESEFETGDEIGLILKRIG